MCWDVRVPEQELCLMPKHRAVPLWHPSPAGCLLSLVIPTVKMNISDSS